MNTNKNLQVRKATQVDKLFVHQLEQAHWNEHAKLTWGEWSNERFEELWADSSYEVVLLDDVPIGLFRVSRQGVSLYINAMHVSQSYRNVGIGKWILNYIEVLAKLLHLSSVKLRVFSTNPARQFYLRHGFQDVLVDKNWAFMEKKF